MKPLDSKYTNWIILGILLIVILVVYRKIRAMNKIIDITDKLPRKGTYSKRSLSDVDRLIVHHTGTEAGRFTMYDVARWHIDPEGRLKAPGIAYHFDIEADGTIYQLNLLESKSWHTQYANYNGIGIVLNGDFMQDQPTAQQVASLKWLIRHLNKKLGKNLLVYGHKEIPGNGTDCPGVNLDMNQFRKAA